MKFCVECDFFEHFDLTKFTLIKTDIACSSFTPFNIVKMLRDQSQYFLHRRINIMQIFLNKICRNTNFVVA